MPRPQAGEGVPSPFADAASFTPKPDASSTTLLRDAMEQTSFDSGVADAVLPATTQVYPAPPDVAGSPLFDVHVLADGQRLAAFVYRSVAPEKPYPEDDGSNEHRTPRRSMDWVTFNMSEPVEVEVTLKTGTFNTVVVRPLSAGVVAKRIDQRTLRIPISKPGSKLSVEFDGKTTNALLLFADPPEGASTIVPLQGVGVYAPTPGTNFAPPAGTRAVHFRPGAHDVSEWIVPAGIEHVYVAGGAVVYGALSVSPRPRFHLTGRGVLSGKKFVWRAAKKTLLHQTGECWDTCIKMFEIKDVPDVVIDGVTIVEAPYWNFQSDGLRMQMRNFKMLGNWRWNSDGPDIGEGSIVEDCFVQSNDDMFKMYWSRGTVRRCVAWHMHNGPVIQLGWWMKNISGLRASDIDVIHSEWIWSANTNNGGINYHWDNTVEIKGTGVLADSVFENIRMEGTTLRAVGLFSPKGQTIRGMTIRGLSVEALGGDLSGKGIENVIRGDNGGRVENVTISNMTVGGVRITAQNAISVGRFVIDPSSTSGIKFE
ncbi:MAG: hypothetical protein SF187_27840 [Deltaproteobacteria bacterium]|nr:hypothetical protein [Deltaproteobacteria bacterium]